MARRACYDVSMVYVVTAVVTALVLIFEVLLGGPTRRDLLGQLSRSWIISAVPAALVVEHGTVRVIVAATGVALLFATLWRSHGEPNPGMLRKDLRELVEREERAVRAKQARLLEGCYDADGQRSDPSSSGNFETERPA